MTSVQVKKAYHSQRDNHPKVGSTIKVAPIRKKVAIANIKKILADRPLYVCLFTLGINTAYRANELLSIRPKGSDAATKCHATARSHTQKGL